MIFPTFGHGLPLRLSNLFHLSQFPRPLSHHNERLYLWSHGTERDLHDRENFSLINHTADVSRVIENAVGKRPNYPKYYQSLQLRLLYELIFLYLSF